MKDAATPLPTLDDRACGILLHPTSLPGPFGCGDLGPAAHDFAAWLVRAGQRWWQMLPVGPVGFGNSPYSASSAFAGSPLLISPAVLRERGWLGPRQPPVLGGRRVDYPAAWPLRESLLREAFASWRSQGGLSDPDFRAHCEAQRDWLDDYALFAALKDAHGGLPWTSWPRALRDRDPEALDEAAASLEEELHFQRFCQWRFDWQWAALRSRCEELGLGLIGDLPIFVAHDSADVWMNRHLFHVDEAGGLISVAGVPPDYFSAVGQRWGNPLYRWDRIEEEGWSWWIERLRMALSRFHAIRLDHFIGFVRYWEIPASSPTAEHGVWREGPGQRLFAAATAALGPLPLIAEDLGAVTPAVTSLRDELGFPGTRILQFAFGRDLQAPNFRPHNYPRHTVVYTGTHDNDTVEGWFRSPGGTEAQAAEERGFASRYLGACLDPEGYARRPPPTDASLSPTTIHGAMIRAALRSVADLVVLPLQDVLGLGSEARMNRPGTLEGNWEWRFESEQLDDSLAFRLGELVRTFERAAPASPPPGEEAAGPDSP